MLPYVFSVAVGSVQLSWRPRAKVAVQEWHTAAKEGREPNPIHIQPDDCGTLNRLRQQIEQIKASITGSGGKLTLRNLAIEYPRGEVRFSTAAYFGFVYRSLLEELELLGENGQLAGPKPNQSY
jgi:hypothetical protein